MAQDANVKRKRAQPRPLHSQRERLGLTSHNPQRIPAVRTPTFLDGHGIKSPGDDRVPKQPADQDESPSTRVQHWLNGVARQRPGTPQRSLPRGDIDDPDLLDGYPTGAAAAEEEEDNPDWHVALAEDKENIPFPKANQSRIFDMKSSEAAPSVANKAFRTAVPPHGTPDSTFAQRARAAQDTRRPEHTAIPDTGPPPTRGKTEETTHDARPGDADKTIILLPHEPSAELPNQHDGFDTGVKRLSPLVTPYRKGRRPRLQRRESYYDGDILGAGSTAGREDD